MTLETETFFAGAVLRTTDFGAALRALVVNLGLAAFRAAAFTGFLASGREGDFAALSHPDNLRFTPGGDLLVLEDNGSDLDRQPATGGRNQLWLFPRGRAHGGRVFAVVQATSGGDEEPVGGEPTGPWFHPNGRIMYLSIQADPSYILAVRGPWMKGIKH